MFRLSAALVGFGVLTILALFPFTRRWDQAVAVFLQRTLLPSDSPAPAVELLGYVDAAVLATAIGAPLLWWINRRTMRTAVWLVVGLP